MQAPTPFQRRECFDNLFSPKLFKMKMLIFAILLLQADRTAANCQFPGAPAHSWISFTNDSLIKSTVAKYYCESGFELLGPSKKICESYGHWSPPEIPFCVLNVAAGKAPMQVSTAMGGVPQRALDGSTSSAYNPDTCTLTKEERVPWWYVNLLEPYMVQLVRLDFGKPCCSDNKPGVIIVRVGNNRPDLGTNPVCNRYIGYIEEGKPLFLPCNPPMPGAFVSVHLEAASPTQLSICEIFVYTDQALPIEMCPQFRDLPPGSVATYNGKCYIFYDRQVATFKDALNFCRSREGTLIDESNPALQGFISWELWRRHRDDSSSSQYWMGAVRDSEDPSNWKWVNGNNVTISFWNDQVGKGKCARFDGSKGWLWADTDCQSKLNIICQHKPKACGRPEQPPNSTMAADNFDVGATVEYSCDDGHLLVGPTVSTCLDTGFYDELPPICKRIECGYPADILHGSYELVNSSTSYLSHVQYSCFAGYEMVGRSHLVCDIDGRWNGPPPRCEVILCEDPPQITNGRVIVAHSSSTFGAVAEYSCVKGFRLQGVPRITCLATGLWDKRAPTCLSEEVLTKAATTTSTTPPTTSVAPLPLTTPRLLVRFHATELPMSFGATEPSPRTTTTTTPTKQHKKHSEMKTTPQAEDSPTGHVPHIIVTSNPGVNQIVGNGNNVSAEQTPRVNRDLPAAEKSNNGVAGLELYLVIAFGILALILVIVCCAITFCCIKRRRNNTKLYEHHVPPTESNTVESLDSSSTEYQHGLIRCYVQAWEDLHAATSSPPAQPHDRATTRLGVQRHDREAPRDGNEMVVSGTYLTVPSTAHLHSERRPRHHHHHREEPRSPDVHKRPRRVSADRNEYN